MTKNENNKIPIYSIFNSISGEIGTIPQGFPVTFIRTGTCNMRCPYCDAVESLKINNCQMMDSIEILNELKRISISESALIITGGEPLLYQKRIAKLIRQIENRYIAIQIETNGTIDPYSLFQELRISGSDLRKISLVVDVKSKSSGIDSILNNEIKTNEHRWQAFSSRFLTYYKYVCSNESEIHDAIRSIIELDAVVKNRYGQRENHYAATFFAIGPVKETYPNLDIFYKQFKNIYDSIAVSVWKKSHSFTPIALNFQLHKLIGREGKKEEQPIAEVLKERKLTANKIRNNEEENEKGEKE